MRCLILFLVILVGCDDGTTNDELPDTSAQDTAVAQDTQPGDTGSGEDTTSPQDTQTAEDSASDTSTQDTQSQDTQTAEDTTASDTTASDTTASDTAPTCDESKFGGGGINKLPPEEGGYCDFIKMCLSDPQVVLDLYPNAKCEADSSCTGGNACTISPDPIQAHHIEKLCTLSLDAGVESIACWVLGP